LGKSRITVFVAKKKHNFPLFDLHPWISSRSAAEPTAKKAKSEAKLYQISLFRGAPARRRAIGTGIALQSSIKVAPQERI
jgi:hypothetical protein